MVLVESKSERHPLPSTTPHQYKCTMNAPLQNSSDDLPDVEVDHVLIYQLDTTDGLSCLTAVHAHQEQAEVGGSLAHGTHLQPVGGTRREGKAELRSAITLLILCKTRTQQG